MRTLSSRARRSGRVLSLVLFTLLMPYNANAASAVVDCSGVTPGSFLTINAALATFDPHGPNDIFVTGGSCVQNVTIFEHDRLTIFGDGATTISPTNANARVLNIFKSDVDIFSLDFTGGRGIAVQHGSDVTLADCDIGNSTLQGINIQDSRVDLDTCVVHDNTGTGIAAVNSHLLINGAVTVENNGGTGINGQNGSFINMFSDAAGGFPTIIRNNGNHGVGLFNNVVFNANGDSEISGNGVNGVLAIHNCSTNLIGDNVIENNGGTGLVLAELSRSEIVGAIIRNNGAVGPTTGGIRVGENGEAFLEAGAEVSGNNGDGIFVHKGGVVTFLDGVAVINNTGNGVSVVSLSHAEFNDAVTISGNTAQNLLCDDSSLVNGGAFLGAVSKKSCKNLDKFKP